MQRSEVERHSLVVEDDDDIAELITFALSSLGFEVLRARNGRDGIDLARTHEPDLITLDLGLPGMDGIEVCRRIREFSEAYVVMVTGRTEEIDRLIGLETGADDFVAKPFSPRELKARVNAMFRRPRSVLSPTGAASAAETPTDPSADAADAATMARAGHEILEHGPLLVDVDGHRVVLDDAELELTRTEFDLLTELMRTPARVWSREALMRSVWDSEWSSDTHLVEVHVGNLRRKLAATSGRSRLIRTVRGVGYRMEDLDLV